MKVLKIILIALIVMIVPLHANKADGIAAGIALLAIAASSSEPNCKVVNYKNYSVGEKMVANPASAIINDKFNACVKKAIVLIGNIKNADSYRVDVSQGQIVNTTKISNGYKIQVASTVTTAMDQLSGTESQPLYVSIDEYGTVIKADRPFKELIGKKLFDVADKIILKDGTFSQEIIYTGISGSELHLQYREYNGNTIKWPFTMDLVYDLKKSNTIKIKHYKIQILEANNIEIVYKVL